MTDTGIRWLKSPTGTFVVTVAALQFNFCHKHNLLSDEEQGIFSNALNPSEQLVNTCVGGLMLTVALL